MSGMDLDKASLVTHVTSGTIVSMLALASKDILNISFASTTCMLIFSLHYKHAGVIVLKS